MATAQAVAVAFGYRDPLAALCGQGTLFLKGVSASCQPQGNRTKLQYILLFSPTMQLMLCSTWALMQGIDHLWPLSQVTSHSACPCLTCGCMTSFLH